MTNNQLAKLIGSLLLVQLFGGIFLNFFLLQEIETDIALFNSTTASLVLGFATIMALILSSFNLVTSAVSTHLFYRQYPIHNILLVGFSVIAVGLTATEYAQLGQFVSLLSHFEGQGIESLNESMELVKYTVASSRNEIHYMTIIISSISILMFYCVLFRATRMPKWITGFAICACLLQVIAVGNTLFQGSVINIIQLPLAITQLVLPIYLIVFGFKLPNSSPTNSTPVEQA